ncbi:MAG TPA: phytanoyl-CoA dioxygenase family protein [Acidobacteriaceae bacterium]|nr:phytanoyl-CoA dioxygenase family protein [Acidobacteriaceae bacterium]
MTSKTSEPEAVKYGNSLSANVVRTPLRELEKSLPLRVLSPEDFKHWQTFGFTVVRQAVPQQNVSRLVDLLWEFQEMDPENPETWAGGQLRSHAMKELNNSGMVEIYNHQYLWDNRQFPRVYDAFVDIWDEEKLWVTIDRANLNTPNRDGRAFGGFIHTDIDTTLEPLPVSVQGVLSLVDVDGEVGGFQCVPEFFRRFDEWKKKQPANRDGFKPDVSGFDVYRVPMKAGDLLIFNSLLAHGIRPNTSANKVRMAQYISMTPWDPENSGLRERRIASWRERRAPEGFAFPGDPREWERTRYEIAELTPLGRRLLGVDSWA